MARPAETYGPRTACYNRFVRWLRTWRPGFAGHVRRLSRGELPPRLRMRPSTITVSS